MKQIATVFLAFAALALNAQQGAGFSERHLQKALQLIDVSIDEESYNQIISDTLDLQIQANPAIAPYRDIMMDFFFKYMSLEAMREEMAVIYAEAFTIQEIEDLIRFYQTPTGRKSAALMSTIYQRSSELGQRRVQEHMPELQSALMEAMQ